MGGFLMLGKIEGERCTARQTAAIAAFTRMDLADYQIFHDQNYTLAVFPKRQTGELALAQFADDDFAFACGTLIYDNAVGKAAAAAFYRDFDKSPGPWSQAMGHYAVILRKGGRTYIVLDSFGGFHVYCDAQMRIASSSFLAVASAVERLTLGTQAAYEYVFNGVVSGDATLFDEVVLAPVNSTIIVGSAGLEIVQRPVQVPQQASNLPLAATITQTLELLDRYFAAVAANFGDRASCALSGGYDSRLILALLRRHAVRANLYVYGPAGDKDIAIAHAIADGEALPLEIVDKEKKRSYDTQEFATVAEKNYLADDGYSWSGIFHNGVETDLRARRVAGDAIALNGGGGEILRNFFYLRDRSYSPREILWSFYSRFDPRTCTPAFDENRYFSGLEAKIDALIGGPHRRLPRPVVEWLYHNFRCRAWDGRVNTINNRFGHAALPFLERRLTDHASAIPIAWKSHGAYEARLIELIDPRLAAYPSVYGHSFSNPPPLRRRVRDLGTYLRPPWLRRYAYRIKHAAERSAEWPGYLATAYRNAVLPGGPEIVQRLFRLERVRDPEQFGRILSLEYLLRQFGTRVRTNI
jgi:hypothetical protein